MKVIILKLLSLVLVLISLAPVLHAQAPLAHNDEAAASAPVSVWGDDEDADEASSRHHHRHRPRRDDSQDSGRDVVNIGHDSYLAAGESANSVVSVFGSASSDGDAVDVVSVFGSTHVTGEVHDSAVAVLGNLYIDGKVNGDAVAVLGSVVLGPHAEIDGDVNAVLGKVTRDPEAVIHGGLHHVWLGSFGDFEGLHAWLRECLAKGRPLALAPGLGWAWTLALSCLALYLLLALVFREGVKECVATLEREPGHAVLAALLTVLLTPVLVILLCVTVIGIAAIPFVALALLCLSLFGKTVILAWLGGRVLSGRGAEPVLAVLVGGLIALALYLVPLAGFLVYKLLGFFGVGAVVYTMLLRQRARQEARADRLHAGVPPQPARPAPAPEAAAAAAAATSFTTDSSGTTSATPPSSPPPQSPSAPPRGPSPGELATYPRAGFWIRMGALFIDAVLVGFLLSFAGGLLGEWHSHGSHHLSLLGLATYGAIMWKLRGSTVGGIVCDLRVVRLDGRPVEWETAIVRALGCFLSLFIFCLGFIWIAIDPSRQAWHDKIAGTIVVRVPKDTPYP